MKTGGIKILNKLLNTLFPETCPVCGNSSDIHRTAPICSACWESIVPYSGPRCERCGRPLVSDSSITCGECMKKEPAFISAVGFGLYDGVLKKAINRLKYHKVKRLSGPLSDILLTNKIPRTDIVLPVPLHSRRMRERGFNQSALLSRHLADRLGMRLEINCLAKIKDTAPQVGLSSKDRILNIKGAYAVHKTEALMGSDILLVDDVFTTGATLRECSKVLKKAGARKIYALTLAHGLQD